MITDRQNNDNNKEKKESTLVNFKYKEKDFLNHFYYLFIFLGNDSISKVTEKDLNGGMICKSLFKPSDAKRIGSNEIITSRNNSIPTKKISNNIVQTDGKSILNRNNSSYLLKASSKDLNNKTGMEYPNNVYNKDIYKPSKSLNTCTGIVKKMENKNELLTNSMLSVIQIL
ncbi:hypothetical protein BCR36DRAFT_2907 [Piromyces finnis]|uniref:Uncharacterized protein n=1 Tax=Piromyces finnis TaxID=1754191 RepID=A0A1Y1VNA1_9FUNG|nr:hypothetical protein BCR36DRAFT_2907 [Piromyces finnis]|eukprot:ORX60884.1 hypothetical protein BCR36DRAFT_2907 [Piromyces finnis]